MSIIIKGPTLFSDAQLLAAFKLLPSSFSFPSHLHNLVYCKPLLLLVVVQSLSCVWLFVTPWATARHTSLSFTISLSLLKLMSIELIMPFNYLILCHPLLLPWFFPSIRIISNELALFIRWPKYWSFSFSIIPSKEIPGLISIRMDCLETILTEN